MLMPMKNVTNEHSLESMVDQKQEDEKWEIKRVVVIIVVAVVIQILESVAPSPYLSIYVWIYVIYDVYEILTVCVNLINAIIVIT